ncbi:MAG: AsmA-like C-terminal region-containing protein [Verrucomicrobiota bacterium]
MKAGLKLIVALGLVVILIGLGLFIGPKVLYQLPQFQSWVITQIEDQSGGEFTFEKISGGITAAKLSGAKLTFNDPETSNLLSVEMAELSAGFELIPVATFKLNLTKLKAKGGTIHLKLAGGSVEQIAFPVKAKSFSIKNANLIVENVHGYTFEMKEADIKARPDGEGMSGSFDGQSATIGSINLTSLSGTYNFSAGKLTLSEFQATLPGESALAVNGSMSLNDNQPLEGVQVEVNSTDIASLLGALGYSKTFRGAADVTVETSGFHRPELKNLEGTGTYSLSNVDAVGVVMPKFPAFNDADILQRAKNIKGLSGEGSFRLAGDRILIDQFNVSNANLNIAGKVDAGLDKSLAGNLNLKLNPGIASEVPAIVRDVFERDGQNRLIIPFRFTGTTNQPRVVTDDMVAKVLANPANAVKAVGNVGEGAVDAVEGVGKGIMNIFGGGKK